MPPKKVRRERTERMIVLFLHLLIPLLFEADIYSRPDLPACMPSGKHLAIHAALSFPSSNVTTDTNGTSVFPVPKESKWLKNNWHWISFITILLVALYIIRRYEVSRIRMSNQVKIANVETEKLKDIDEVKSRFYANISHDFRTPLTLIKGPLEQLISTNADPEHRQVYSLMHNNASRLLELVNQMLDLSKLESGNYSLKAQQGDIVDFVEGLAMSFASLAEEKNIVLKTEVGEDLVDHEIRNSFYYDPDILDKIINNLISNAFKFTPKGGRITVHMRLVRNNNQVESLEISIEDTGSGIAPGELPYIFDRFYQADSNDSGHEGTGIGLSIVHELIRLHIFGINVQSEPGSGTVFNVLIPVGHAHLSSDQIVGISSSISPGSLSSQFVVPEDAHVPSEFDPAENLEQPWILVVEDHDQVRKYIIDCIQKDFRILQASNAPEGYKIALEFIPDLIISDIMMPGIDGFRFCEKIKNCTNTSHIPIILLTARADINDRITGLKWGADDYLTKPFNAEELRIRINNLIDSRNALREKFSTNSIIKPGEISVSSHDAQFMETLLGLVEKNINNIHYSVEEFANDSGLSQSQLHRKLKAIIFMSAIQFIRSVRMHRAMELLKNGAGNIAEVAFMVGYDNPGYFTKSFRKFFDKLPSEVTRT